MGLTYAVANDRARAERQADVRDVLESLDDRVAFLTEKELRFFLLRQVAMIEFDRIRAQMPAQVSSEDSKELLQ